jgi:hypothetical protein
LKLEIGGISGGAETRPGREKCLLPVTAGGGGCDLITFLTIRARCLKKFKNAIL